MVFADDYQSLVDTLAVTDTQLIITELSLPTEHDLNVLRAIRGKNIDIPIIAIGDYDEPEARDEVKTMGAAAFVLRTTLGNDIIAAIEQVLSINQR